MSEPKQTATAPAGYDIQTMSDEQLRTVGMIRISKAAAICREQGRHWDSDAVIIDRNYADYCADLIEAGAPAQGQQVECQECERKQKEIDLLWSDRRKDADLIHQLHTELAVEIQRRWDGNEQSSREHREEIDQLRAELSALKAQQAELIEDRARFPDRPDDIGHMIGAHIENLKAGKLQAERYARKWRNELESHLRSAPAQDVAGWIPVTERLPSCGQAVLAYYLNRQGLLRRIRAEYVTRWTVEAEMFADPDTECVEHSEQEDTYYVTEGWYELIDNWDEYARIAVNEGVVTNWMPLPAAPAHDRQSGGEE